MYKTSVQLSTAWWEGRFETLGLGARPRGGVRPIDWGGEDAGGGVVVRVAGEGAWISRARARKKLVWIC